MILGGKRAVDTLSDAQSVTLRDESTEDGEGSQIGFVDVSDASTAHGYTLYQWRGADRNGREHMGSLESVRGPAAFVETRFNKRWRWLDVTVGDRVVGQIDKVNGRRVWWSE